MTGMTLWFRRSKRHHAASQTHWFHLEMAPPVGAFYRRLQYGLVIIAMSALALTAWWWQQAAERGESAGKIEGAAAALDGTQRSLARGLPLAPQQVHRVKRQVQFANLLTSKRAFSWSRLLRHLDEAIPAAVSLDSIQMNFADSTVSLDGTVWTLSDLNALVDSIDRHTAFKNAVVVDHRIEAKKGPNTSGGRRDSASVDDAHSYVVFRLVVVYRPNA